MKKRFCKIEINVTRSVLKTLENRLQSRMKGKGTIEDQFISLIIEAWRNGKRKLEVTMKDTDE